MQYFDRPPDDPRPHSPGVVLQADGGLRRSRFVSLRSARRGGSAPGSFVAPWVLLSCVLLTVTTGCWNQPFDGGRRLFIPYALTQMTSARRGVRARLVTRLRIEQQIRRVQCACKLNFSLAPHPHKAPTPWPRAAQAFQSGGSNVLSPWFCLLPLSGPTSATHCGPNMVAGQPAQQMYLRGSRSRSKVVPHGRALGAGWAWSHGSQLGALRLM